MDDLNDTIENIASGINSQQWKLQTQDIPDPSHNPAPYRHTHQIEDGDYGQFFDFEVQPDDDGVIFYAHSDAALKWAFNKFHEDMDRTSNGRGWILSKRYIGFICRDAEAHKLVNKETALENEEQDTRRQWDD